MTTTKLPTTCTGCDTKLTKKNRTSANLGTLPGTFDDMCLTCYEEAGVENEHADGHHDDTPAANCPECNVDAAIEVNEEIELINPPAATGRKNFNHANCVHPRTPKGRAACRAAMAAGNVFTPEPVVELLPTGTVGKGKSVHLMLVMGDVAATVCNPKRVLGDWNGGLRPMTDVTCKSCIKLS